LNKTKECHSSELNECEVSDSNDVGSGIVIGIYISTDADGRIWLKLPIGKEDLVSAASCLCDLSGQQAGTKLAVMFVEGRIELPVVVGPVFAEFDQGHKKIPEKVEICASEQIVLKCGKATLRLQGDGSAVIRGEKVVSRASGTNRIRGGNVQIN